MIYFHETDVSINGVGILAQNIGVSVSSEIQPLKTIGRKHPLNVSHTGPIATIFQVQYIFETDNEPLFDILESQKNFQTTYPSLAIEIGGLSGVGYLQGYSLG